MTITIENPTAESFYAARQKDNIETPEQEEMVWYAASNQAVALFFAEEDGIEEKTAHAHHN